MHIPPNSKLLFIGDSITDCGRKRPIGQGASDHALGNGYVSLINAAFTAVYPDYAINIINMGIAGDTIRDLKARWKSDVLDLQPNWLAIKIGINDVWRQINNSHQLTAPVTTYEYAQILDLLIQQSQPLLNGLILITPYFLEPNHREPMRSLMDQYRNIVIEIAAQHQALLVDTQTAFDTVLQSITPMQLSHDQIHPNLSGHMILARTFLQAIGFSWDRSQPPG